MRVLLAQIQEGTHAEHALALLVAFPPSYWREEDRKLAYEIYPCLAERNALTVRYMTQTAPSPAWSLFFTKEARYRPVLLAEVVLRHSLPVERLLAITSLDFYALLATALASASMRSAASSRATTVVRLMRSFLRQPPTPQVFEVLQWFAHCFVKQLLYLRVDSLSSHSETPYTLPSLLVEIMYALIVTEACPPFCARMLFSFFCAYPSAFDEKAIKQLPRYRNKKPLACLKEWQESKQFPRDAATKRLDAELSAAVERDDKACDLLFLQWSLSGVGVEEVVKGVASYAMKVKECSLKPESASVLTLPLLNSVELVIPFVTQRFLENQETTEQLFKGVMGMTGESAKDRLVLQRLQKQFVLCAVKNKNDFFYARIPALIAHYGRCWPLRSF